MIRALVFEALGVFVLVFCTMMMERPFKSKVPFDGPLVKGLVDFFVYLAFYHVGVRVSGCHLNPVISFAMAFTPYFTAVEVL